MSFIKKFWSRTAPPQAQTVNPSKVRSDRFIGVLRESGVLNLQFRFIAVDVETANSDPASICQLGLACVAETGEITPIDIIVDPECAFDDFNTQLHGFSAEDTRDQLTFDEAFQPLRAFLQRQPLIQHSNFDKRAIEGACARYELAPPQFGWHDSVTIARRAWPELKDKGGHGLGNLKKVFDIEFQHHNAAEDARAAAQVVLLAEKKTGQTFEALTARKPRATKTFEKPVAVEGDQNGPLFGQVACFTGSLNISREQAATIAAAGVTVKTSVTKKTSMLVVGDQDLTVLKGHKKSSKHRHAEELIASGQEIRILNETGFLELVQWKPDS